MSNTQDEKLKDDLHVYSIELETKNKTEKIDTADNVNKEDINDGLTLFQKICFALAALPYQMYFVAIGVFATIFLLDVAQLPPSLNRIMDAITDPIYGFIVNKTKVTRFGRLKPWILVSVPLSAVAYIMAWYIPTGFSETQKFVWLLIWHSAFFTLVTGQRIPHMSMTMYLCLNQGDRLMATIFRMGFEMLGILLALGIQGFVVTGGPCIIPDPLGEKATTKEPTSSSVWDDNKYAFVAVLFSVIFISLNIMLLIFVKERTDIKAPASDSDKKITVMAELKRIFTFKPYLILITANVFNTLGVQIVQANLQLFFDYGYPALKKYFTYIILLFLGIGCLAVPLWRFIMARFGKRFALAVGNLTIAPLLLCTLFIFRSDEIYLYEAIPFLILALIGSNCFTATFLVPWSMLPEVADAYFIKYRTKPDALFYTFFVLGTKIMMAIYLGISQLVLDAVGFKNNVCSSAQNPGVKYAVIYLLAPAPLAFLIISSIVIYFFPITTRIANRNSEIIKKIKNGEKIDEDDYDELKDYRF